MTMTSTVIHPDIREELDELISRYDTENGGKYAHGGVDYNSTWLCSRFKYLLRIIEALEAERNEFALHIARGTVDGSLTSAQRDTRDALRARRQGAVQAGPERYSGAYRALRDNYPVS